MIRLGIFLKLNTIGMHDGTLNVDDIVETSNHFKGIDLIIDMAGYKLSESFIKQLHRVEIQEPR